MKSLAGSDGSTYRLKFSHGASLRTAGANTSIVSNLTAGTWVWPAGRWKMTSRFDHPLLRWRTGLLCRYSWRVLHWLCCTGDPVLIAYSGQWHEIQQQGQLSPTRAGSVCCKISSLSQKLPSSPWSLVSLSPVHALSWHVTMSLHTWLSGGERWRLMRVRCVNVCVVVAETTKERIYVVNSFSNSLYFLPFSSTRRSLAIFRPTNSMLSLIGSLRGQRRWVLIASISSAVPLVVECLRNYFSTISNSIPVYSCPSFYRWWTGLQITLCIWEDRLGSPRLPLLVATPPMRHRTTSTDTRSWA